MKAYFELDPALFFLAFFGAIIRSSGLRFVVE
jgi:hypothetical protein